MTPAAFRRLPKPEQVEMMAHRREVNLRKAHAEHAQEIVAKIDDPTSKKPPAAGQRRSRF